MAEPRTPTTPLFQQELEEIRRNLAALAEWYGVTDFTPGADLESLIRINEEDLIDAASVYLRTKDFPQGIEGAEMSYRLADTLKEHLFELTSITENLEQYRKTLSALSEADRLNIALGHHFETAAGPEAEAMLKQFDDQISDTIARSSELKDVMENAYQLLRKPPHRLPEDAFHRFTADLIHVGMNIARNRPAYSKSDQVSGPWIDYLLSATKPLRLHTTPGAVANEIDRWKSLRSS